MKSTILGILLFSFAFKGFASNEDFFSLKGGFLFPETYNLQLSYEHSMDYDTSFELFGEIGSKFRESHRQDYYWSGGIGYAYPIKRYKNAELKLVPEIHSGAFTKSFFFGAGVSFEYNYVFRNGVRFVIQQKNQVNFRRNDTFKNGLLIGFKIPL